MYEIELKFQIPGARRAGVRRAVDRAGSRSLRLQAHYFDTPGRHLATAGLALRLRKEGGRWVQTLKGRGDGLMLRLEHEVVLPRTHEASSIDLSRHDGTPAGHLLAQALRGVAQPPTVVYVTDIQRTRRQLRSGGAVIELAFDEGAILAGGARLPVCELEFELLRGDPVALLALAWRWVERHGLWLDVRSKAERGDRLARGEACAPPCHAEAPALASNVTLAHAWAAMLRAGLAQVLPNAAEVAAGTATAEHLHQLRIGLRRLRTALREFGDGVPQTQAHWQAALAAPFARLGVTRDRDALAASVLPLLEAVGAPRVELHAVSGVDAGAVVREPSFSRLMIELIAGADLAARGGGAARPLTDALRPRLNRMHRRVSADAAAFASLDEATQHRVRKRLKRLRYACEFVASLYPPKAVARYLAALRPAQEALGAGNDLTMALAAYRELTEEDPRAWFAVGWLSARRAQLLQHAVRTLRKLAQARRFWR